LKPNAITGDNLIPNIFGNINMDRNIATGSFGFGHFDGLLDKITDPNTFRLKTKLT